ncbi:glycosyl hydrolase family 20 [Mycoplasmopsis mustelae]|uniref:Glycosyl hydrolase family 20 n=1 Tax=Mycoplasmopsis mustelae TaxID=171289 RepID=A0A4R7UCF2_9BACT|nr:beta-N-acetylglucosaminidase domain-containing protein [Mycoplasmopsis mustelae]TDV24087.1 glycosyl hydrolase family 20 [Mycoplasmopsis mustelae]
MKINKKMKLLLGSSGMIALIASAASMSTTSQSSSTTATSNTTTADSGVRTTYKFTPTVQSIKYDTTDTNSRTFLVTDQVNLVFENGIDDATKKAYKDVLDAKGLKYTETRRFLNHVTNLIVGINNNADKLVDAKIYELEDSKLDLGSDFWKQNDAYRISTKSTGFISVLAKNTDAAYYAAQTLAQVFNQLPHRELEKFVIQDFASLSVRGFLDQRNIKTLTSEELSTWMKYGSKYKLNSYLYAPRDDQKRSSDWRTLYNQEELDDKIKPLAALGKANKFKFVYTVNPFADKATAIKQATYTQDLDVLKAKLMQLADAGASQFALFADNANVFPEIEQQNQKQELILKLLNDLTLWIKDVVKVAKPDFNTKLVYLLNEDDGAYHEWYREFPSDVEVLKLPSGGQDVTLKTNDTYSEFSKATGRGASLLLNLSLNPQNPKELLFSGLNRYYPIFDSSSDWRGLNGVVVRSVDNVDALKLALYANANYSWKVWNSTSDASKVKDEIISEFTKIQDQTRLVSRALKKLDLVNSESFLSSISTFKASIDKVTGFAAIENQITTTIDDLIYNARILLNTLQGSEGYEYIKEITPELIQLYQYAQVIRELIEATSQVKDQNFDQALSKFYDAKIKFEAADKYSTTKLPGFTEYLKNPTAAKLKELENTELTETTVEPKNDTLKDLGEFILKWLQDNLTWNIFTPTQNEQTVFTNLGYSNSDQANLVYNSVFYKNNRDLAIFASNTTKGDNTRNASGKFKVGDYFGTLFKRPIVFKDLAVQYLGAPMKVGSNNIKFDHFKYAKIQYLLAGDDANVNSNWHDVTVLSKDVTTTSTIKTITSSPLAFELNEPTSALTTKTLDSPIANVIGVRILNSNKSESSTEAGQTNVSFKILQFLVNSKESSNNLEKLTIHYVQSNDSTRSDATTNIVATNQNGRTDTNNLTDSKFDTDVIFWHSSNDKNPKINDSIGFKVDNGPKYISSIVIEQDKEDSNGRDSLQKIEVEYFDEVSKTWKHFGSASGNDNIVNVKTNQQYLRVFGGAYTTYFRIKSRENKGGWWKVSEVSAYGYNSTTDPKIQIYNKGSLLLANSTSGIGDKKAWELAVDKNPNTFVSFKRNNGNVAKGGSDFIDVVFDRPTNVSQLKFVQGENAFNKVMVAPLQNNEVGTAIEHQTPDKTSYFGFDASKPLYGLRIYPASDANDLSQWDIADIEINDTTNYTWAGFNSNGEGVDRSGVSVIKDGNQFVMSSVTPGNKANLIIKHGKQFGFDLGALYDVKSINLDQFDKPDNIIIQASADTSEWHTVTNTNDLSNLGKIRYITFLNNRNYVDLGVAGGITGDQLDQPYKKYIDYVPETPDTTKPVTTQTFTGTGNQTPTTNQLLFGKENPDENPTSLSPISKEPAFVIIDPTKVTFNKVSVVLAPQNKQTRLVSGNLRSLNDSDNNLFDQNFDTQTVFVGIEADSSPKQGQWAIYDLGYNTTLSKLKLYANTNSYNYPRNLDVYVSNSDASDAAWTKVLTINDDPDYNQKRLLYANTGTLDTANPNYKYWANDAIDNVQARYLKLVVNADYPNNRNLGITEIKINDATDYQPVNDPRFSGELVEKTINPYIKTYQANPGDTSYQEVNFYHRPVVMLNQDLNTYWEPKADSGTLAYRVSNDEFKNKALRVVSLGTPSNATIEALLFDTSKHEFSKKELGTLFTNILTFMLPNEKDKTLVALSIKWKDGHKPKIASFGGVDSRTLQSVSVDEKTKADNLFNPTVNTGTANSTANSKTDEDENELNQRTKKSRDAFIDAKTKLKEAIKEYANLDLETFKRIRANYLSAFVSKTLNAQSTRTQITTPTPNVSGSSTNELQTAENNHQQTPGDTIIDKLEIATSFTKDEYAESKQREQQKQTQSGAVGSTTSTNTQASSSSIQPSNSTASPSQTTTSTSTSSTPGSANSTTPAAQSTQSQDSTADTKVYLVRDKTFTKNSETKTYSDASWNAYLDAVTEAKVALLDKENISYTLADSLYKKLVTAKNALTAATATTPVDYSAQSAQLDVQRFNALDANLYNFDTYNSLKTLVTNYNGTNNKTTDINNTFVTNFDTAYQALTKNLTGAAKDEYQQYRDATALGFVDKYQTLFPELSNQVLDAVAESDQTISQKEFVTAKDYQDVLAQLKTKYQAIETLRNNDLAKYQLLTANPISNQENVYSFDSFQKYQAVLDRITTRLANKEHIAKLDIAVDAEMLETAVAQLQVADGDTAKVAAKAEAEAILAKLDNKGNYQDLLNNPDLSNDALTKILANLHANYAYQEWNKFNLAQIKVRNKIKQVSEPKLKDIFNIDFNAALTTEALAALEPKVDAQIKLETDFANAKAAALEATNAIQAKQLRDETNKSIDSTTDTEALQTLKAKADEITALETSILKVVSTNEELTKNAQAEILNADTVGTLKDILKAYQTASYINLRDQLKAEIAKVKGNEQRKALQARLDALESNADYDQKIIELNKISTQTKTELQNQTKSNATINSNNQSQQTTPAKGVSGGVIAAIVISLAVAAILAATAVWLYLKKRKK